MFHYVDRKKKPHVKTLEFVCQNQKNVYMPPFGFHKATVAPQIILDANIRIQRFLQRQAKRYHEQKGQAATWSGLLTILQNTIEETHHRREEQVEAAKKLQGMFRRHIAQAKLRAMILQTIVKCIDPDSRRVFYYNRMTGESQWVPPKLWQRRVDRALTSRCGYKEATRTLSDTSSSQATTIPHWPNLSKGSRSRNQGLLLLQPQNRTKSMGQAKILGLYRHFRFTSRKYTSTEEGNHMAEIRNATSH
jgi:hypothetical protein